MMHRELFVCKKIYKILKIPVTLRRFACIYNQKANQKAVGSRRSDSAGVRYNTDMRMGITMTNMTGKKITPITTIATPVLIVAGVLVKTSRGAESFVTLYSRIAAVIIAAFVAYGCIRLYKRYTDEKLGVPVRTGFCIATFFAVAQNLVFMAYGLYRSLTMFDTAGLTITAIGGFLIVYAIDTVITVNGIRMFIDKPWGMIAPMLIACAGANLINLW